METGGPSYLYDSLDHDHLAVARLNVDMLTLSTETDWTQTENALRTTQNKNKKSLDNTAPRK